MKVSEIPFTMTYHQDDSFIDRPDNLDEMIKGIDFILQALESQENDLKRASLHSTVGYFLRIVNKLEESEDHLINSYEIFKANKSNVAAVIAKYRLALVYLYQKNFTKADSFFLKCIDIFKSSNDDHFTKLSASLFFSIGLSKLWQKEIIISQTFFSKALEIAVSNGDMKIVESSQKAIGSCQDL